MPCLGNGHAPGGHLHDDQGRQARSFDGRQWYARGVVGKSPRRAHLSLPEEPPIIGIIAGVLGLRGRRIGRQAARGRSGRRCRRARDQRPVGSPGRSDLFADGTFGGGLNGVHASRCRPVSTAGGASQLARS